MPKRRVVPDASEDEGSAYAASVGSNSDGYTPENATVTRRTSKAAGRRKPSAPLKSTEAAASFVIDHSPTGHVLASADSENIAVKLLAWFSGVHAARGMPWRKPFNPAWTAEQKGQRAYEVWVSEIMLQQTQVATVIPYYNRWMEKFPTLTDLAAGSIDEVHALWKGLGYYSRASRLLEGAQKVITTPKMQSRLPEDAKSMEDEIPGIGRYSAGAICSIAYGERVPVLDGNVHRLLSRILALHAPPKAKATLDILWAGATALVTTAAASSAAGDLNQSLIELGSTICKPRAPACTACPIRHHCRAFALQSASARPSVVDLMKAGTQRTSSSPSSSAALAVSTEVSDIEELCGLCTPIPDVPSVESFPMRAEKKKAREETDTVRVVEWRIGSAASQRWFVLVKRPQGGLLGGLEEFPTESEDANVGAAAQDRTHLAVQRLIHDQLTTLGTGTQSQLPTSEVDPLSLRVIKDEEVGDVLHIFSHIRKTYRVRWVILEGGDGPPSLRPQETLAGPTQSKKAKGSVGRPVKKRSGEPKPEVIDVDEDEVHSTVPLTNTRWVPLDKVTDANIGTGVVKIWNRVRARWTDE